ncbi:Sterol 3-beta-glucosyltransferase [Tolypocladium paradoxum]|uniref:Sterol 3-beta-glucosyltransferase n=1 Tax=Tolypocladium paradoxum TaxID=94208 RepID=A0A2S4KLQ9_9HYPO|nr:Sterol 3-beta-glucosyltransferase [Tolypocladium paradoxum]
MADHVPYIGSGPYCYANSLAMMLGRGAPSPAVLEFATSSPFGMEIIGSTLVFFDPYGWEPASSFDAALAAAGWQSTLTVGKDADDALARLKEALKEGPVFVGPVEMGHLRYQPGMKGPLSADHYVVVLRIDEASAEAELHDPHGHPYATLPVADLMTAWRAESLGYGRPFMMRSGFRQVEEVAEEDVIRRSLANARRWLAMEGVDALNMPRGSSGNGEAAIRLAAMVETGLSGDMRVHLTCFAVRVGARRLADAATCLARVGCDEAARVAARQARLVGALQHPLVVGDKAQAAAVLRRLAPTYEELKIALGKSVV